MTQRTKKIRIPIATDEQGNCFVHGWAFGDLGKGRSEDYDDMEEQSRDMHDTSYQHLYPKTVVTRWVTVEVPLPEPESEVEGVHHAG